ncbi:MAG: tyrosine-type recombinase/integrase [Planctomycetota bacterium]|jgi:integrase
MSRKKNKFPKPNMRFKDGSWRIYWSKNRKVYEAVIGKCDEDYAKNVMHLTALALLEQGDWPLEIADAPAVKRYISLDSLESDSEDILSLYIDTIKGEVSSEWAKISGYYLKNAKDLIDGFTGYTSISQEQAQRLINSIAKDKSTETRNKYLQVYSRFCDWMFRNRKIAYNPFKNIRIVKTRKKRQNIDINYFNWDDREYILKAADTIEDGISVWIAFFAGLRRGEIFSCEWSDINFKNQTLVIPETKTGSPRTIPIADTLAEKLKPLKKRSGLVIPRRDGMAWKTQANHIIDDLRALRKKRFPKKKVLWNNFRHTFCTLLVMKGLSIDIVAAYAGNDPKTCREWYTQFVPVDQKDERINLLEG